MRLVWLVDFDDTLAAGPLTWGYEHALPQLIQRHQLPSEPELLEQSLLVAQEMSNKTMDLDAILDDFCGRMNWPKELGQALLQDVLKNYRPRLFPDAASFLAALHAAGHTVVVCSNNPRAPVLARELGLQPVVDDIITPHLWPGVLPKPDRGFWERVMDRLPAANEDNTIVVGDDPWSDVVFAEQCGLRAWLVDRHDRFACLEVGPQTKRVRSLQEIQIP